MPAHRKHLVDKSAGPEACWPWLGFRNPSGYGMKQIGTHTALAHRWMYEQNIGAIPAKLTIDHICGVRHCVNPAHLEPVTQQTNNRRSSRVTLTESDVREIKACAVGRKYGDGVKLGVKYGVSGAVISKIWNCATWKDVTL